MLEIALSAQRGSFHLEMECRFFTEWTVISGPSGAGKSTLLRLLAGLDRGRLSPGAQVRVVFEDRVLTDTAARIWTLPGHRHAGLVAQQPALFPHLDVFSNVAYGLPHLDRSARKERVAEMLALVGADELMHRRPQDLSGGERQRVALARALGPAPRLLLLDEPFSALDTATSEALLERLHAWVRSRGVKTVLATHDAADAFATGAEVALLREGRLMAQGPAREVLAEERQRLLQRLSV